MAGSSVSIASDVELQLRLTNDVTNRRSVAVALCQDRATILAGSDPGFPLETPVLLGCVAKCLTATLLAQAMESSSLDMMDSVADLLQMESAYPNALNGVEFGHLLNHTHGLDDADVDFDAVPRREHGYIDVDALCTRLADVPRIGEPGEIYSYGGAGAWLAAAFLEQHHHCTYLELLRCDLLDPLGIETDCTVEPRDACPAWGGRLALSAVDLLRFLRLHVADNDGEVRRTDLGPLRAGGVCMPGWGPWQRGATWGWNLYGDDWLGHNGNRDGTGIALRFHRREPLAVAVTSPKEADCVFALATLFGDALEEFSGDYVRIPKLLDPDAWEAKDTSRLLGDYENARWRVNVAESGRAGFLRMRVFDRRVPSVGSILDRHLRAAENDVFLAVPPGVDYPFVQFVGEEPVTGHAKYFWNGRQLWRFAG